MRRETVRQNNKSSTFPPNPNSAQMPCQSSHRDQSPARAPVSGRQSTCHSVHLRTPTPDFLISPGAAPSLRRKKEWNPLAGEPNHRTRDPSYVDLVAAVSRRDVSLAGVADVMGRRAWVNTMASCMQGGGASAGCLPFTLYTRTGYHRRRAARLALTRRDKRRC